MFASRNSVLRKWRPGLPLAKDELSKIPVWAKFHNVPIELWTEEGLSHIASVVGLPLYADAVTEACSRISFAQICIELDASTPLVDDFEVELLQEDGSSKMVTIFVSYQWRPTVCEVCQVFGHASTSCKHIIPHSGSASLVQALDNPTQSMQAGHSEDPWQLVEK